MRTVVTLKRFLALTDVVLVDTFGREHRISGGRGGYFDPAGAQPLIQAGQMVAVPDKVAPANGTTWPASRFHPTGPR